MTLNVHDLLRYSVIHRYCHNNNLNRIFMPWISATPHNDFDENKNNMTIWVLHNIILAAPLIPYFCAWFKFQKNVTKLKWCSPKYKRKVETSWHYWKHLGPMGEINSWSSGIFLNMKISLKGALLSVICLEFLQNKEIAFLGYNIWKL